MIYLKRFIQVALRVFNLKITRDVFETEVPAETLCAFLQRLRPQNVTKMIRVGSKNDGGYVVPFELNGTTKLFSPGCDGLIEFERDLYARYKIPSIVMDHISKKPSQGASFIDFQDNWLDATTTETTISLGDWVVRNSDVGETLMLQMDIEGAEYEVLRNTASEILNRFHTIIIEFHYFEMIKNSFLFETKIKPVFDLLLSNHIPIYLNPNNCCGEVKFRSYRFPRVFEITLIRRSDLRKLSDSKYDEIPNSINIPLHPPIVIDWNSFEESA